MQLDAKYISSLVIIITTVASLFNITIVSETLTKFIEAFIIVVSGIIIAYKQFKQGGINIVGVRKPNV